MTKNTRLKNYLKSLIKEAPASLEAAVAAEALEHNAEDIAAFFSDVLRHGCQSGIVSGLIYYVDTHSFYDRHYDEIEELRHDLEDELGQPLQPNGDLKNWFAWLAFEETARKMLDELGIEW